MNLKLEIPQLDEALKAVVEVSDQNTVLIDLVKGLNTKMDALALAISAPGAARIEPAEKPERAKARRAAARPEPVAANGEDEEAEDNEEDLRAEATFEAKRTTRQFGIGRTRTAIRKVGGPDANTIDDVPAAKLPKLVDELRALQ